jgi:PAS domain S-box-containing protein
MRRGLGDAEMCKEGRCPDGPSGDPEDLVGRSVTEVLPTKQARRIVETIERTVETGEPQLLRYEMNTPGGTRVFEARTSLMSETEENKELVSFVTRDVTDLPGGDVVPEMA